MKKHQISTKFLSIEKVTKIIERKQKIELSEEAIAAVKKCRDFLDTKAAKSADPIYGVTTGFGSLCNKHISAMSCINRKHFNFRERKDHFQIEQS